MPDLSRIGEREKLKPKTGDEPHWQRLRQGVYLGYRPSKKKAGGTWFARCYDVETSRNSRKRLGDYGKLTGHDVFKQAKADAEIWANTVESGGELARDMVTIRDACEAYLREKPGSIAEGVFRRHVYSDPIAKVKLDKLRRHHLKAWRKRLEQPGSFRHRVLWRDRCGAWWAGRLCAFLWLRADLKRSAVYRAYLGRRHVISRRPIGRCRRRLLVQPQARA
mgnify:CR=1 FL=1